MEGVEHALWMMGERLDAVSKSARDEMRDELSDLRIAVEDLRDVLCAAMLETNPKAKDAYLKIRNQRSMHAEVVVKEKKRKRL